MRFLSIGKFVLSVCAVLTFLVCNQTAFAQVKLAKSTPLSAVLSSQQEIPAPTVTGTPGGVAVFTMVQKGKKTQLFYDITVSDLSGAITGAHIHNAALDATGAIIKDLMADLSGNTVSGVWSSTDANQPFTAAFQAAALAGELYVNFHTAKNPAGEIRGQIIPLRILRAKLNPTEEVPAPTISTDKPSGTATLVLQADPTGARVDINVTVARLSGPVLAGHCHNGPVGMAGPVVKNFAFNMDGSGAAVWRTRDAMQPLTAALLKALLTGQIYANCHTAKNAPGEIRGQVGFPDTK